MGCTGSKTTSTKDKNQSKNTTDGTTEEETYVTVEEAENYVKLELSVDDEKAKKIIASINKNQDGKVSNKELVDLWKKIKAKKEEMRAYFKDIDKDGSGYISLDEAVTVLKTMVKGVDEEKVKALIKRFDENNDSKIKYDEFVTFYAHISAKRDEICQAIASLDKDDNGAISAEDIVTLVSGHCGLDDKHSRSLVNGYDKNNDGKINSQEFEALLKSLFP